MTDLPAIISKADAIAQGLKFFFTGIPCRNGHISERYTYPNAPCVKCLRENSTKHLKARPNYKPRPSVCVQKEDGTWHGDPCPKCGGTERAGKTRLKCPTCWRERSAKDKERRAQLAKERHAKYPEKYRPKFIERSKRNPAAKRHHSSLRRIRKKHAIPSWVDARHKKALIEMYEKCPDGYELDHVIPLAHKMVTGLHCLDNLQYLPAGENRKKFNKWPTCQKSMQPACFDNLDNGV